VGSGIAAALREQARDSAAPGRRPESRTGPSHAEAGGAGGHNGPASRSCCSARTTTSASPTTRRCARRQRTRRCAGA
jgi:hypothetical protein